MRRGLLVAYLFFALCVCGAWQQSGLPVMGSTQAPVSGGTTVIYASNFCLGAGTVCTLNTGASAGQGIAIIVWGSTTLSIPSTCTGGSGGIGDGTGTGNCTGSSTYHPACTGLNTPISGCSALLSYVNGSNFATTVWYTCNYSGSGSLTITATSGTLFYAAGVVMSGQTTSGTGCNDGYNHNQLTTTGTSLSCGAITNTNTNDLLVGFLSNSTGAGTFTAGTDSQGNSMTIHVTNTNVIAVETFNETAVHAYNPLATYSTAAAWSDQCMLFK